jgi:NAD(P)-dependent dehydrogenase (short-subunit alcohol dehydrogenase family)
LTGNAPVDTVRRRDGKRFQAEGEMNAGSLPDGWNVGAGLEGEGIIVTGAARGIGAAVAAAVASTGARVMAVDLNGEALQETVAGLPGEGHVAVVQDLSDLSSHGALVLRAQDELGGLWGIAHMAAVLRRRSDLTEVTEEDWDVQIDVNLKAAFFLCREVGFALQRAGRGGRIVTFTSQGWWTGGFGGSVVYCAAKGGVVSFTRGLARTFGAAGITVNSVSPGAVETPMLLTDLTEQDVVNMEKATPLGRLGKPHELAGPVVFLLSQHASFVSGATLNVSGAWLMY